MADVERPWMARACPEQAYRMRAFRRLWPVNGSPLAPSSPNLELLLLQSMLFSIFLVRFVLFVETIF